MSETEKKRPSSRAEEALKRCTTPSKREHIRIGLVGAPKVGKTRFLGTMPKPLVVIDFDEGATALLDDAEMRADIDSGRILVREVPPDGTIEDVRKALNDAGALVNAGMARTVAIDSFTFMCKPLLQSALELENFDFDSDELRRVDMRSVVGNINRPLEFFLSRMKTWPAHLVVTAHIETRDVTKTQINRKGQPEAMPTGDEKIVPMAYGAMRDKLSSYFDELWHITRRPKGSGSEYIIRPQEFKREFVGFGSRLNLTGDLPPDFRKIMAKYVEGGGDATVAEAFLREL
jgi:hypothetical protein